MFFNSVYNDLDPANVERLNRNVKKSSIFVNIVKKIGARFNLLLYMVSKSVKRELNRNECRRERKGDIYTT